MTKVVTILYSDHAVLRMFERNITEEEVEVVIKSGETIENYPKDKPYPSCLKYKKLGLKPIHVVVAVDDSKNTYHVVSVYIPDLVRFEIDYRTRKKSKL